MLGNQTSPCSPVQDVGRERKKNLKGTTDDKAALTRLLRRSDDGEHYKELRVGRVAAHQNIREGLKMEEPLY